MEVRPVGADSMVSSEEGSPSRRIFGRGIRRASPYSQIYIVAVSVHLVLLEEEEEEEAVVVIVEEGAPAL